jgi:hypothetical protein
MSVGGGDTDLPRPPGLPEDAGDYEAAVRKQEQRESDEGSAESAAGADESGQRPQRGYNEPLDPEDQPGEFGGSQTITPPESGDKSNT